MDLTLQQPSRRGGYPVNSRRITPDGLRKWTMGLSAFDTVNDLLEAIEARKYIFFKGRRAGYHWSFIAGWPLRYVAKLVEARMLFPGVRGNVPYQFRALLCPTKKRDMYFVSCDELGHPAMFQHHSMKVVTEKASQLARILGKDPGAKAVVSFFERT